MGLVLGKQPRRDDPRTLKLARYLLPSLPAVQSACDLSGKVAVPWGMYRNDSLGDCTCAAAGHMVMLWSAIAGKPVVPAETDILAAYNAVNGGVDQGAVELDVLNLWRKTGIGGDTLLAFAEVDPANGDHVRQAFCLFEGLYIGLQLPLSASDQFHAHQPWTPVAGPQGQTGSWGGHSVN